MSLRRIALFLVACVASTACTNTPPSPAPSASFEVPATVKARAAMPVQNTSANATSYFWQWGDGTTATELAPSHTYFTAGLKRVVLTAMGPGGTDTLSKVVQVEAGPSLAQQVAGSYHGTLYYQTYYRPPSPTDVSISWRRDTTLQVTTTADTAALIVLRQLVSLLPTSSAWDGHQPVRPNYSFKGPPRSGGNYTLLQKAGDSLYVYSGEGGLGSGYSYRFYAKRQ
jgi:PKD repeat protein